MRNIEFALTASDEQVGPACMLVPVPPTIADDHDFREAYTQGYRHALSDVREYLALQRAKDKERGNDG